MKELDLDRTYTCTACDTVSPSEDLLYPTDEGVLFVCPYCGCVQELEDVERQLLIKEDN